MNAVTRLIGDGEAFPGKSAADIARTYVKTGIDWTTLGWTAIGLSAIALSTFATWTDRFPLWAGFLVNGYFMFFIFATMHEASHGNIAHGRLAWLNGFLGWLCGFVNVISYRGWGDLHAVHHSQVNDPVLDPDGWMTGKNPFNVVFRCATIPPHYVHYYLSTKAYDRIKDGWFCFFSLFFPWILALGVSALVWQATGDWRLFVLWPLAGYLCIFLTGVLFVWFPHYPKEGRGRTDNSTTYIFKGPVGAVMRLVDLWQSYHLIHHAYPRVPFYRQGRLFDAVRDQVEADGSVIIEVAAPWHRRSDALPAAERLDLLLERSGARLGDRRPDVEDEEDRGKKHAAHRNQNALHRMTFSRLRRSPEKPPKAPRRSGTS